MKKRGFRFNLGLGLLGITIASSFILTSCGFQPLYSQNNNSKVADSLLGVDIVMEGSSIQQDAEIGIRSNIKRLEQLFKAYLSDNLNPSRINTEPVYVLKVALTRSQGPTAIQRDTTVTRYNMIISADYQLIDKKTNLVIGHGTIRRQGEYDAVQSDYSTYISAEDSADKIAKELATDLKYRVTSHLLNPKPEEETKLEQPKKKVTATSLFNK